MKVFYSEVFQKIELDKETISKLEETLPEKFFLAYTIQFKPLALEIKKRFKRYIIGISQILGCSKLEPKENILLLSEGKFHAKNLMKYAKKLIIFDGKNISEISKEEIERSAKEDYIKFKNILSSNELGILISTKYGQYNIGQADIIKKELEKLGKKPYFFFFDTLNKAEFENFNIKNFIVVSCPGISYDSKQILDSDTFLRYLNNKK
jgi:diphthamide biosynthesis enzyme Dph1/Dph2-like protein